MTVDGSSKGARELADNLKLTMFKLLEETNRIKQTLIMLSDSYIDSGFQDIFDVVSELTTSLRNMEDICEVFKKLHVYASILDGELDGVFLPNQKMVYSSLPRQLNVTLQSYQKDSDNLLKFNHPEQTRKILDLNQGKVAGFKGTCGLVSCVNILRLAGVKAEETDIVNYAKNNGLCTYIPSVLSTQNGGTSWKNREIILEHFGINMCSDDTTIENIAYHVESGHGVIISVYASALWFGSRRLKNPHAITVTSVKKNLIGDIVGFYVADSGIHEKDGNGYYTVDEIKRALTGAKMNFTKWAIR